MTIPSAAPDAGPHAHGDDGPRTTRERHEALACVAVLLAVLVVGASTTISRGPLGADVVWPGILIAVYVASHTLGRVRALHNSRS
jgi:hypothetical protein